MKLLGKAFEIGAMCVFPAALLATAIFCYWSMYFVTEGSFGIVKGILAFILLGFFFGAVMMIPFGLGIVCAPILFEWFWHDVPFWHFSDIAWMVVGFNVFAVVVMILNAVSGSKQTAFQGNELDQNP